MGRVFGQLYDTYSNYNYSQTVCIPDSADNSSNIEMTVYYYTNETEYDVGMSWNTAGDMNGDGIDDIVIGFPTAGKYAGQTYIVYGSAAPPSTIDLSEMTPQEGYCIYGKGQATSQYEYGDLAGLSVGGGLDVNSDGYSDILIGAPNSNGGNGKAYVIYGTGSYRTLIRLSNLLKTQGISIVANELILFGVSVSTAGDFNNDGYDDLIAGVSNLPYSLFPIPFPYPSLIGVVGHWRSRRSIYHLWRVRSSYDPTVESSSFTRICNHRRKRCRGSRE
jgi:hypothetical protein